MTETRELPDGFETLEELTQRAFQLGAKEASATAVGWEAGPERCFEAQATIVTADGEKFGPFSGWASPGDCQAPDASPADDDVWVRDRALTRALRRAMRLAYGKQNAEGTQPAHVKQAHLFVRNAARAAGMPEVAMLEQAHKYLQVAHLADITPEQAHTLIEWLRPWVTGEE